MGKSLLQQKLEAQKQAESGEARQPVRTQNRLPPQYAPPEVVQMPGSPIPAAPAAPSAQDMKARSPGKRRKLAAAPAPDVRPADRRRQEEQYEEEMVSEEVRAELRRQQHEQIMLKVTKAFQVFLIIACVYLVFLIYGISNTSFVYDARGMVVPQVLSVDEIRDKEDFGTMQAQYLQARVLYEKVLVLDYRLAMNIEDPLLIAPEYEKLLEDISSLSIQIGALTTPARYAQSMQMLLNWVRNDIALYCQNMSAAISQNSSVRASHAMTDKANMYNDFMLITENVAKLGSKVKDVDITDLVEWSPDAYLQKYAGEAGQ